MPRITPNFKETVLIVLDSAETLPPACRVTEQPAGSTARRARRALAVGQCVIEGAGYPSEPRDDDPEPPAGRERRQRRRGGAAFGDDAATLVEPAEHLGSSSTRDRGGSRERRAFDPGFPMWHPSAKLSVARNRSKGESDGFCHQDHARQHEIESEWDMVAFDIAGRAVSRTHRSCRLHGWCGKVGGKLENWRKLLIVKHSERRCAAAERSLRHETSYGIDVAQSIFR